MLDFKSIQLEDRKEFKELLSKTDYESSEFSFANIFIWAKTYDIKLCKDDGVMYISATIPETNRYVHFQPICPDENKLQSVFSKIKEDMNSRGEKFYISDINEHCIDMIADNFPEYKIEESRDMFDYLYLTTDLSNLAGKKYHKKRTHVNKFTKENDYEYRVIDDTNKDDCLKVFDAWIGVMASDPQNEREAIVRALENMEELEMFGAILYVEDEPIAFTIGEGFRHDTALIHIEKAVPQHRNAFTVINQQFAKRELLGKYEFINREEDMGIEGLRRAKMGYYPCRLIKKYNIYEQ